MKRYVCAVMVAAAAFLCSSQALASAALATVDDAKPDLAVAANGWTADIGLTNTTTEPIQLSATTSDAGCHVTPIGDAVLPAATHATVTFAVTDGCSVANGLSFSVVLSQGGASQPISIVAGKPTAAAADDWAQLNVFWLTPALALVGLIAGLIVSARTKAADGWSGRLEYLDSTWSFSDSWVNTITAGAGVLTGLFGSTDVAKALLGKDPGNALDLAVVGSAIAVALIAAAPIVLGACRSWKARDYTIVGLFVASACTLGAAIGELWIMGQTARHLPIAFFHDYGPIISVLLAIVLMFYAIPALAQIVDTGITAPPPSPVSDTLKGADAIAAAIRRIGSRGVATASDFTVDFAGPDEQAGAALTDAISRTAPPKRRSALL